MEEWKTYKLSEIAQLLTGFPFDGSQYSKEGIRVVRGDNVTVGSLRWETDKDKGGIYHLTEQTNTLFKMETSLSVWMVLEWGVIVLKYNNLIFRYLSHNE